MHSSKDLAIPGVSNLAEPRIRVTSLLDKNNEGSHIVHIAEKVAHNFWAISRSQVVEGELPVAYPVDRRSWFYVVSVLFFHINMITGNIFL